MDVSHLGGARGVQTLTQEDGVGQLVVVQRLVHALREERLEVPVVLIHQHGCIIFSTVDVFFFGAPFTHARCFFC